MKNVIRLIVVFVSSYQIYFGQDNTLNAVIEQEGLDIVYVGIPLTFKASGGGADYKEVKAVPEIIAASPEQVGKYISVQCVGKDKKGKEVVLGTKKYLVKATPKPILYIGDYENGAILDSIPNILNVRFGDNIPLSPEKAKLEVTQYSISVEGIKGSLDGAGNTILENHLNTLKAIPKGKKLTILVEFTGVSSGKVSAMFEL